MYQLRNFPDSSVSEANDLLNPSYAEGQIGIANILGEFETIEDLVAVLENTFATTHYTNRKSRKIKEQTPLIFRLLDKLIVDGVERQISDLIPLVEGLSSRNPNSPSYIIQFDNKENKFKISSNLNSNATCLFTHDLEDQLKVDLIQHVELMHMVSDAGVVISAPSDSNFVLPSNTFTNVFYRAGNVQQRTSNLETLYFWLRPFLADVTHIIAESWSVSTLLYFIAKKKRNQENINIEIEFLGTYFDDSLNLSHFSDFLEEVSEIEKANLLVVFSATMTGYSFERVKANVEVNLRDISPDINIRYLSLLSLLNECCETLLDLKKHQHFSNSSPNPMVLEKSIPIDKSLYVPLLDSVFENKFLIKHTKNSADKINNPRFFERYGGQDLFSFHRTTKKFQYSRDRHHAYYIDFKLMSKTKAFRRRSRAAFTKYRKAKKYDLVIFSEAPGNNSFFRHLENDLQGTEILKLENYECLKKPAIMAKLKSLDSNKNILILEGVTLTGDTLAGYQINLRGTETKAKFHYFIGLARPESEDKWNSTQIGLQHGTGSSASHHLMWVEKIFLPNWERNKCPWCRESSIYRPDLYSAGNDLFSYRRQFLANNQETGLSSELFFSYSQNNVYSPLNLTHDSFFFDVSKIQEYNDDYSQARSDAEIMCAAASALQGWRTDPKFQSSSFKGRLDRATLWGENHYSDTKIRAAIWRSLLPDEVLPRSAIQYNPLEMFIRQVFSPPSEVNFCTTLRAEAILRFPTIIDNLRDDLGVSDAETTLLDMVLTR